MEKVKLKGLMLRGYFEQTSEKEWFGICITLNLPVTARSLEEAEHKLWSLISDYLEDVTEEGDFDKMVPRRAPLYFYLRYFWYRCLSLLNRPYGEWQLFSRSASSYALNA